MEKIKEKIIIVFSCFIATLYHDEWYCVECRENDRIWYPAHGSAESRWQNDYINMYYEQKEKFEKKYLSRINKDPIK